MLECHDKPLAKFSFSQGFYHAFNHNSKGVRQECHTLTVAAKGRHSWRVNRIRVLSAAIARQRNVKTS